MNEERLQLEVDKLNHKVNVCLAITGFALGTFVVSSLMQRIVSDQMMEVVDLCNEEVDLISDFLDGLWKVAGSATE